MTDKGGSGMKTKEKLHLMREIEVRNQARIKRYLSKPRKRPLNSKQEKAEDNMGNDRKEK